MIFDGLKSGMKMTENFIKLHGLIKTPSLSVMYQLKPRLDLTANSDGVFKENSSDTSRVYQLQDAYPDIEIFTAEYNSSQTNTVLIASPGDGKRLILVYGSIRTEGTTGEAFFIDGGQTYFKVYLSAQTNFAVGNLNVHLGENKSLKLTSTQGAKRLFVAVQYYIADV